MMYMGSTPSETWELLRAGGPFKPFRDAAVQPCSMPLAVLDILEVGALHANTSEYILGILMIETCNGWNCHT